MQNEIFFDTLKERINTKYQKYEYGDFCCYYATFVLVILGFIYGTKPAADGVEYTFMEPSFGALCTISICAGGLMGLPLVVSEYRGRRILKRFQVTPVSPVVLLAVEFTIYVLYCIVSLLTLMIAGLLFWKIRISGNRTGFLGSWLLTMMSTLSIGMMVGGIARNTKTASVIACVLYFPMLFFSGATLPFEIMPDSVQKVISIFPMTQGIQLMKATFLGLTVQNVSLPIIVMGTVTVVCTGIAVLCFKWK